MTTEIVESEEPRRGRRLHGTGPRGEEHVATSRLFQGRFGRMFRELAAAHTPEDKELLLLLAATMKEPTEQSTDDQARQEVEGRGG